MKSSLLLKAALLASCVAGAYIDQALSSNGQKPSLPLAPLGSPKFTEYEKGAVDVVESYDSDVEGNVEDKNGTGSSKQLSDDDDDEESKRFEKKRIPTQCSQGNYRISSPVEMDQLQNCEDVIGSIVVSNYHGATIDTGNIHTISGDFIVSNATNLVRINTPNLAVIDGRFSLNELTSLTAVHAPYLNTVGSVDWRVLPILSTVNFESGITSVRSITISDTSLVAFSGFDSEVLDTLNVNNNRFLESIVTGIRGINEKLSISANARNLFVSFPQLEWANNITVRDVSSIDFGKIERVNTSLEFINNNFQALKFPKLKSVGGTLSLIENYNLKDVEFNNIDEIGGGLMVVNNTFINRINFFPKLTSIGGAIEFVGDLKEASFNKLRIVKGSALIESVSDMFDCQRWTKNEHETSGSIIRGGSIVCKSGNKRTIYKYGNDGEVLDEQISTIDDSEGESNRHRDKNESSMKSGSLSAILIAFAAVVAIWS